MARQPGADKDLNFMQRLAAEQIEGLLHSWNLSPEVVRGFVASGSRALSDIKALVYGGTLANGTQTKGFVAWEAYHEGTLDARLERLEVALQTLSQQIEQLPMRYTSTPVDDVVDGQNVTSKVPRHTSKKRTPTADGGTT